MLLERCTSVSNWLAGVAGVGPVTQPLIDILNLEVNTITPTNFIFNLVYTKLFNGHMRVLASSPCYSGVGKMSILRNIMESVNVSDE